MRWITYPINKVTGRYWKSAPLKTSLETPLVRKRATTEVSEVPEEYYELLRGMGIETPPPPVVELALTLRTCCAETYYSSSGDTVCYGCCKVLEQSPNTVFYYSATPEDGRAKNSGVQNAPKKRPYESRIHFRTQLRRYMCQIGTGDSVPQNVIDEVKKFFDCNDRYSYFTIREWLRANKISKYYPFIFKIIWKCGGKRHTYVDLGLLERKIRSIQSYFYAQRLKFKRKSMPCVSLMLELILKDMGSEPFYHFYKLKASKLHIRVLDFYEQYKRDVGVVE